MDLLEGAIREVKTDDARYEARTGRRAGVTGLAGVLGVGFHTLIRARRFPSRQYPSPPDAQDRLGTANPRAWAGSEVAIAFTKI